MSSFTFPAFDVNRFAVYLAVGCTFVSHMYIHYIAMDMIDVYADTKQLHAEIQQIQFKIEKAADKIKAKALLLQEIADSLKKVD
jgi:hypothetical protein